MILIIDILENPLAIELLKFLGIIATIIGSVYLLKMKLTFDTDKIVKELKAAYDAKFYLLEKHISDTAEDIEASKFRKKIELKIKRLAFDLVDNSSILNSEFQMVINNARKFGFEVIREILISDFEDVPAELKSRFRSAARSVKKEINFDKLFADIFEKIDASDQLFEQKKIAKEKLIFNFYEATKNHAVYPAFAEFINSYEKLQLLSNGVRRESFEKATLKLVRTIIKNTIRKYEIYTK